MIHVPPLNKIELLYLLANFDKRVQWPEFIHICTNYKLNIFKFLRITTFLKSYKYAIVIDWDSRDLLLTKIVSICVPICQS